MIEVRQVDFFENEHSKVSVPSDCSGEFSHIFASETVILEQGDFKGFEFDTWSLTEASVILHLSEDGKTKLFDYSAKIEVEGSIQLGILVNGTVVCAPVLHEPLMTDELSIDGFTIDEARQLTQTLNATSG